MVSGRSRLLLVLVRTDVLIENSVQVRRGISLEILWVEENWENNVTFAMLKIWIRKEQIIRNFYLQPH